MRMLIGVAGGIGPLLIDRSLKQQALFFEHIEAGDDSVSPALQRVYRSPESDSEIAYLKERGFLKDTPISLDKIRTLIPSIPEREREEIKSILSDLDVLTPERSRNHAIAQTLPEGLAQDPLTSRFLGQPFDSSDLRRKWEDSIIEKFLRVMAHEFKGAFLYCLSEKRNHEKVQ
jgi:hypothetical protein